ncbi:MAG: hypothetical protein CVT95_05520 [Bacteroidetes bacterium HGW-Bacteroidetes-12]|nr:MAG: hypothetical protein CVT95_05520 [Bacteroidetes bacterium HGW-Bacteroidetes-12]
MNYPENYFVLISIEEALLLFNKNKEIFLINEVTNIETVAENEAQIIAHWELDLPLGYHRKGIANLEIIDTNNKNRVLWARSLDSQNVADFLMDSLKERFKLSEFETANRYCLRLAVISVDATAYRCTRKLFSSQLFVSL